MKTNVNVLFCLLIFFYQRQQEPKKKLNQNLDIWNVLYCMICSCVSLQSNKSNREKFMLFGFDLFFYFSFNFYYYCFMIWIASQFARQLYTFSHLHFNKCFICLFLCAVWMYVCVCFFLRSLVLFVPGCYCLILFRFMRCALAGIHKNIM